MAEEGFTLAGQLEGAALKQGDPQAGFQLEDLSADGWLLNAIGNMARCRTHAMMFGNVIEEFEVMNVHVEEALVGEDAIGSIHFPRINVIFQCRPSALRGPAEDLGKL